MPRPGLQSYLRGAGVDAARSEARAHPCPRGKELTPIDGWVLRTVFEPEEQVPPGAPVVVVGDLQQLTLRVFLPESQFGRVMLEQIADITVDAYTGETFVGQVISIASEAEFAPGNIQTREDRVKMVYAIKLNVPNRELRLKPGMFADATFPPSLSSPEPPSAR